LRHTLGLDLPLAGQYLRYLRSLFGGERAV
jgi:hypothetical protein